MKNLILISTLFLLSSTALSKVITVEVIFTPTRLINLFEVGNNYEFGGYFEVDQCLKRKYNKICPDQDQKFGSIVKLDHKKLKISKNHPPQSIKLATRINIEDSKFNYDSFNLHILLREQGFNVATTIGGVNFRDRLINKNIEVRNFDKNDHFFHSNKWGDFEIYLSK